MSRIGLVCANCGGKRPFSYDRLKCGCGGMLLVDYDLERAKRTMTKPALRSRDASMWRYRELLPVIEPTAVQSLGEGWTPLTPLRPDAFGLRLQNLWVKREELNPTGSFKARGLSAAVSLLAERNARHAAIASNGNAASALAAYAARAGIEAYVFVPEDCPPLIVRECMGYGAHTFRIKGQIHDAGAWVEEGHRLLGWTSVATLKEPGRIEGKKTMGFEIAEQLGWKLPTVLVYPTGGGSGVIGLWKAFRELRALGLVSGDLPRIASVQVKGCAPLVAAVRGGGHAGDGSPVAPTGLRVPYPPDLGLLARIVRETEGTAVAVERREIEGAQRVLGAVGISASPEGGAAWAGLLRLHEEGWIRPDDRAVVFNTSHALKYESGFDAGDAPVLENPAALQSWKWGKQ